MYFYVSYFTICLGFFTFCSSFFWILKLKLCKCHSLGTSSYVDHCTCIYCREIKPSSPHVSLTSMHPKDSTTNLCHANCCKPADQKHFFLPHLFIYPFVSLLIQPLEAQWLKYSGIFHINVPIAKPWSVWIELLRPGNGISNTPAPPSPTEQMTCSI